MMMDLIVRRDCGGCDGKGSHWRWCPVAVGPSASHFGRLAEQAEALGDQIGANHTGAANHAYVAAGLLKELALNAKQRFLEDGRG